MKNRTILSLLLFATILASCGRTAVVREIAVVPEPLFVVEKEGSYTLGRGVAVAVTGLGQNEATVKYIMTSLRKAHLRPTLVGGADRADISLVINDTLNPELGDEGYLLEVQGNGILLSANSPQGLLYAYQTLAQLLPPDVTTSRYRHITLPACTLLDRPAYPWRGAHLDVCHHFFSTKFVKRYLDILAYYKLNRFVWHLADSTVSRLPLSDGTQAEGRYSADEIADVVAYARDLSITVVPQLEVSDSLCHLLPEVAALFSSPYMVLLPLRDSDTITATLDTLVAHGKQLIGWRDGAVVAAPSDYCALQCYQADPRWQPAAIGGLITLEKSYQFNPCPPGTNRHLAARIVGGNAELWTDLIATPGEAEYMLLPRLLAIGEALWSPADKRSWSRFRRKVEKEKERLTAAGITYCEGSFTPRLTAQSTTAAGSEISITTEVPNTYIFYTTDGSTPTRNAKVYLGPIRLQHGTHLKILPVYNDRERDTVYEFIIR